MGKNRQVICNICNRSVRSNNLPCHLRTHGVKMREVDGINVSSAFNSIKSSPRNNINPCVLIDTSMALQAFPSYQDRFENFDIRLKENFKLFISGPSRCGKTFFVSDLIENIEAFSKQPPSTIIYVYKVWQTKFDEMRSIVHMFIPDNENIVNQLKDLVIGQPIFVIFDDLLNSNSLADISNLFTVDGRHMNMSMAFITQRMFVNNEHFRQISQNCDYFCVFKNPRNSSEIRTLAQQLTPGSLDLVDVYMEATKDPFTYLFINLTQECPPKVKYLSRLFDWDHSCKAWVIN